MSRPPAAYEAFLRRFPALGRAWQQARDGEDQGPLDERSSRLVKLAVAIGLRQEGPTHSAARKALQAGIEPDALYQVVALAAATIGFPSAVAAYGWIRDVVEAEATASEDTSSPPR